jgi:CubicO group peptidase (beta-lactamase class C family)
MTFVLKGATQLTLAASAVLCLATPVQGQFEDVRASIERKLVEQDVPSLAVAVARNGVIIWEEGFGWADREKRIPATEHTMYSLASISKPITATGLMVLVERGLVDLDRPINDYLGDAKVNGRSFDALGATVRLVANHTAGLPLHDQFFYEDEPYRRPAMDETIRRYANLVTAPGERYQYSNLGFGIIDYVLERTSGKSYPDFMREAVFLPLGLTRTSVDIGPGLEDYAATRYAPDGSPIPFYDFDHPGGSAVFSSAHDLVRFGMFHLKNHLSDQRPIISDAAIDEMAAATVETSEITGYGIGWATRLNEKGLRMVSHGGGMGGVATQLVLLPDENIAIAVLCNSSEAVTGQIARELLAALVPDKVEEPEPEPQRRGEPLTAEQRGRYVGTYDLGETQVRVFEQRGQLMIEGDAGTSPLSYQGDQTFVIDLAPNLSARFELQGELATIIIEGGEEPERGTRQPPGPGFKPLPDLTGTWVGTVDTYEGALSVTIAVHESGAVHVQLGEQPWTLLNNAVLSDGYLRGRFAGDIGTEDANRRPYRLRMELKLRGDTMNGSLIAMSLPGNRVGNALTHWIEVRRM